MCITVYVLFIDLLTFWNTFPMLKKPIFNTILPNVIFRVNDFMTHSSRLLADPFGIATNFPTFAVHAQCRLYYFFYYQTLLKVSWKVNISDKNRVNYLFR